VKRFKTSYFPNPKRIAPRNNKLFFLSQDRHFITPFEHAKPTAKPAAMPADYKQQLLRPRVILRKLSLKTRRRHIGPNRKNGE